ncbi:MAG TPA: hypothetical protein VF954_03415 [Acidimicrobiales bacterium]
MTASPGVRGALGAAAATLRRRALGRFEIDEWGADPELVDLLVPALGAVTRIRVHGATRVPERGPALLVVGSRLGLAEPFVVVAGLRRAAGRRARFAGIPDVAPIGLVLRRLGGAVGRPGEVAGLLHAGHLVLVTLSPEWRRPLRAGTVEPELIHPALGAGAPILPVAAMGGEISGRWQVVVGEPIAPPRRRTGRHSPLALAELADAARAGVQELIDEASPPGPSWLGR